MFWLWSWSSSCSHLMAVRVHRSLFLIKPTTPDEIFSPLFGSRLSERFWLMMHTHAEWSLLLLSMEHTKWSVRPLRQSELYNFNLENEWLRLERTTMRLTSRIIRRKIFYLFHFSTCKGGRVERQDTTRHRCRLNAIASWWTEVSTKLCPYNEMRRPNSWWKWKYV